MVLFSVCGFVLILFVKILIFLIASDFKTIRAVLFVICAGFVSTIIGLLIMLMSSTPDYLLVGIVIIFLISIIPASRLKLLDHYQKNSKFTITFIIAMITLVAIVLFAHSIGYQAPRFINLSVKIILSLLAIALSIMLSIVYEETIIFRLYKSSTKESKNFYRPVIWMNIVSFIVVSFITMVWALIT